ncbi:hypothetical protein [Cardinium endosymbiont of Bemisia tabaci]|uniref:hypothetical protein n=1 Tax=Cardinium endosymbiont of Bemisia tabaci TaxID=672794 RepID=UPI000554BB8F|nr:hypothetical protein [Cardinium endosymbiont of Bemisia tabaci]
MKTLPRLWPHNIQFLRQTGELGKIQCRCDRSSNSVSKIYGQSENVTIRYNSDSNKVDKIVCNNLLHQKDSDSTIYDANISHNHITVDSGGGISYTQKDTIKGCRNVIVSPNTIVTGDDTNYNIYIKSKNSNLDYAESNINIPGIGTKNIIFPEISLLNDATSIKYNSSSNRLIINIPLSKNDQYELALENYLTNTTNITNYVLIDRYGNNIVLILDKLTTSHDIKNFLINAGIDRNMQIEELVNHYHNITYTEHNYNILGKVRYPNNDLWKFGSVADDIIENDDNTIFISGGEGSDLYVVTQTKKDLNLSINNYARDFKLDILSVPFISIDIILIKDTDDLILHISPVMDITILDYFRSKEHQHIVLMDQNNNTFIPFAIENGITLMPFCHKSLHKSIFTFTGIEKHMVIDIDIGNIMLYKQGNDLLITEQTANNVSFGLEIKKRV